MARSKQVTQNDYAFDDESEASSFSQILSKTKVRENPDVGTEASQKSETKNPEQTENKPRTNPEQTKNKPRTELRTNSEQTENKLSTQPRTELRTNSEQTENKLRTNSSFSQLVGLQKKIIEIMYGFCRSLGEMTTGRLSLEFLSSTCEAAPAVVQVTTRRLVAKGVLAKFESKEGRGGWTRYSLPEPIYKELFQLETENKLRTNPEQTENKLSTQPRTQPRTSAPCSSSDLNISPTTTTEPDFWLSVPKNLDGLVSVKQLREHVRNGLLSADELQTSLDGFAFDLEKGVVRAKNGNPVAILMGAVKAGGYISQQYMADLRASLAEVEKARAEIRRLQAESSSEQLRTEFEAFRAKFPEQAERLKPATKFIESFEPNSVGYRLWLDEFKRSQGSERNDAEA